jgi:hypothetical protein
MKAKADRIVIMVIFLGLLSGCASLPKEPSVADPRSVYVWPLATCPSSTVAAKPAFVFPAVAAGLATPLLTDLVSGLVALPVAAIQNAATADATGFKANGQNPRFYFSNVVVNTKSNPPQNEFTPPGCYVVAYTTFAGQPAAGSGKDWCDDKDFSASVPKTCSDGGKKILESFGTIHDPEGRRPAVPDFYAEIELVPSGYQMAGGTVVRPRVIALHYPASLVEPKSTKPRLVTVSLNLASPGSSANDPMKPASLGIVLQGVVPASVIGQDSLASQQASWIAMPTNGSGMGSTMSQPTGGEPYFPVNISATLTEAGDPNVFLQAFAKAVAGSAADYSKAIVNAVPPLPTVATLQQNTSAEANVQSAVAQAATDEAKLVSACNPAPTTEAQKAAANAAYQTVLADRMKANAAALSILSTNPIGGVPSIPFDPIDKGLKKCF